jgi:uncharacterized membrane protein
MINNLLSALTFVSALGCGLIAGVFFAFSAFVMKALASLPTAQGLGAMQSINLAVLNPWFLGTFFGTAVGCILLAVISLFTWQRPGAAYLLVGSVLYLFGTVLVTRLHSTCRVMNSWRPLTRQAVAQSVYGLHTLPIGQPGIMCGRLRLLPQQHSS